MSTDNNISTLTFNYLKGAQGPAGSQGPAGAAGRTPVKGTDYWTAADRASMVQDVLAALPNVQGVSF